MVLWQVGGSGWGCVPLSPMNGSEWQVGWREGTSTVASGQAPRHVQCAVTTVQG